MRIIRHGLTLGTTDPIQVVDITDRVRAWVRESGVRTGLLTVISPHTTARVNVNERDPALQRDMVAFLGRIAPRGASYAHDENTVDGRDNAHAHLLGLLLSSSASIPVVDGQPELGTWQSIFFIELDGPRNGREVKLVLIGEEPRDAR